jgi:hypothetical protein
MEEAPGNEDGVATRRATNMGVLLIDADREVSKSGDVCTSMRATKGDLGEFCLSVRLCGDNG